MRVTNVFVFISGVVLASCIQVTVVGTHRDAVSRGDAAEIERVVSQRRDLPFDELTIRPLSADAAAVESSGEYTGLHTFTVRKVHGVWQVDNSTIQRHLILH